ncbi:MAG: VWA domain-containing protein [Spirochaetes bacterium]|nr:VWA domain-containing protein [Spirochaetota bacterium]
MAKSDQNIGLVIVIVAIFIVFASVCSVKSSKKAPIKEVYIDNRYQLQFGDSFQKGMNSVDDLGLSVVLAVDCSGSMGDFPSGAATGQNSAKGVVEKEKYKSAAESLGNIVDYLEGFYNAKAKKENLKLKIGIITFNHDVKVLYNLTEVNEVIFKQLKALTSNISNFYPEGATAIGSALAVGTEILAQSGTIFKSLITITDGENSDGVSPDIVLEAIVANRNNKSTTDYPIITNSILVTFIGFDFGNSYYFKSLNEIGARIAYASNKDELIKSMENIFEADITKLEAK